MFLDITTVLLLIVVVYLTWPNRDMKQLREENEYLENMLHSAELANRQLANETSTLTGKVVGLEVERETLEREVTEYRGKLEVANKRLTARGL